MCSEPQRQEIILEPVDILGIDELSQDGMVIRLIVKTQPSKQWVVGREFRLRVEQALDKAGIFLGVPQQEVAVIPFHGHTRENNRHQLRVGLGESEK